MKRRVPAGWSRVDSVSLVQEPQQETHTHTHQINSSDTWIQQMGTMPLGFNQGAYINFSNSQTVGSFRTEGIRPATILKSSPEGLKLEPGPNSMRYLGKPRATHGNISQGPLQRLRYKPVRLTFPDTEIGTWV